MMSVSVSPFTLITIRAGRPAAACSASRSISSRSARRRPTGATSSCAYSVWLE